MELCSFIFTRRYKNRDLKVTLFVVIKFRIGENNNERRRKKKKDEGQNQIKCPDDECLPFVHHDIIVLLL